MLEYLQGRIGLELTVGRDALLVVSTVIADTRFVGHDNELLVGRDHNLLEDLGLCTAAGCSRIGV